MKALKILSSIALLAGLMACGGDSKSVTGPEDNGNADQLKGDESLAPDRDDGQEGSGVPDNSSGGSDPNILIDPATDPVIDPAVVNTADLIQLLEAAGISVEKTSELVEQPFFTPAAQILKIGDEAVQVFEYETVEALKTEARQVAPDGSSIGTTMVSWVVPPRFYATGNIIVLYVGQDESMQRTLDAVLGSPFAGADISLPPDDLPVHDPAIATVDDLARRLEALGLEVMQTEEGVELEFLTPVGQVISVNGEELLVFSYDSVEQLKAEAVTVPEIQTFAAVTPTRYFAIANFIAVYTGDNLSILTALDGLFGGPFSGPDLGLLPDTIEPGEPHPLPPPTGTDGTIFELQNPSIVVASTASDLRQLVSLIQDPELGERLAGTNLEESIVIAVFRGEMRTAGYGIEIEEVRSFDDYVEVTVSFTNPGSDELVAQVITYPVAVRVVLRTDVPAAADIDWIAVTPEGESFAKFNASFSGSGSSVDGGEPDVGVVTVSPDEPDEQDLPRSEGPVPPTTLRDADIRGTIVSFDGVDAERGIVAQILVEGEIESDTDYDKALVSITEETRIVRISADDAYAEAGSRDLVPGTSIQVQFTGPVMESYPVQAVALHLVILE